MQRLKFLTVFFPVYNEEANLPLLLQQTVKILPYLADKFEILIINDGSQDQSLRVARHWARQHSFVKVISHQFNLGYGAALKTGFREAQGDWVFFTDADLQFKLTELVKLIYWSQRYQVIIGYRQQRAEGWSRSLNARLFKLFIDLLYRLHVTDIDCAFKLLDRRLIQSLDLVSSGAFTTSEMLYRLKKQGIKFKELPVSHYPRQHGLPTGSSPRVILKALWEATSLYLQIKISNLKKAVAAILPKGWGGVGVWWS